MMITEMGFIADEMSGICLIELDPKLLRKLRWRNNDMLKVDMNLNENSIMIKKLEG